MSEHSEDPAHQLVTSTIRATLMAATVTAEQVARSWREAANRRAAMAADEADRWQARYDSQRHLAGIEVNAADQRWVDAVGVDQVARVWETARAWSELESVEFAPAADRIRAMVKDRYGVDLAETTSPIVEQGQDPSHPGHLAEGAGRRGAADEAMASTVIATPGQDAATDHSEDGSAEIARFDPAQAEEEGLGASTSPGTPDYDTSARRALLVQRAAAGGADQDTALGRGRAADAQARPTRQAPTSTFRRPQDPRTTAARHQRHPDAERGH